MERFSLFVLLVVLLIVQSFRSHGLASKPNSNTSIDQSSLLALKSCITSDPHNKIGNNWMIKNSICSWIGVTCDPDFNRVIALNISNMELVGRIAPEIGNLSFLVSLDMNGNSFHGSIPPSIFNMSSLEVLKLRNNSLSSSLPIDMCKHNFHRLKTLDISYNELYGEIPSSLDKCSQLEYISLYLNKIVGHVPRKIVNLSELHMLDLGGNNLNGMISISVLNLSCFTLFSK
ncbi:hypothetical protein ACS0TY_009519 [Phlomoides rotata]